MVIFPLVKTLASTPFSAVALLTHVSHRESISSSCSLPPPNPQTCYSSNMQLLYYNYHNITSINNNNNNSYAICSYCMWKKCCAAMLPTFYLSSDRKAPGNLWLEILFIYLLTYLFMCFTFPLCISFIFATTRQMLSQIHRITECPKASDKLTLCWWP